MLTIQHILCNPKYKGWYCAGKSQTVDYHSKRKIFLDEDERVMYPAPSIPAIVSEELWDRANALYKRWSQQMRQHQSGATFHNRYPYSGKIVCEAHRTSFHRQVLKSARGDKEVWQCRVYRDKGRAACSAPQLRTAELDQIMANIFNQLVQNKQAIIDAVVAVLQAVPDEHDYAQDIRRIEEDLSALQAKKDRLLEMSIEGVITTAEFKQRNDGFNQQAQTLEERLEVLRAEGGKGTADSGAAKGNPRCPGAGALLPKRHSLRPGDHNPGQNRGQEKQHQRAYLPRYPPEIRRPVGGRF